MSAPPGATGERTALAWQRTATSVLVLSVATMGLAVRLGVAPQLLTAALATIGSASAGVLVRFGRTGRAVPVGVQLVALVVAVVALAAAGVSAAVLSAGADSR